MVFSCFRGVQCFIFVKSGSAIKWCKAVQTFITDRTVPTKLGQTQNTPLERANQNQ